MKILIKYDDSYGNEVITKTLEIPIEVDPSTQIGTARFSLECLQDIVALAKSRGMNIELGS